MLMVLMLLPVLELLPLMEQVMLMPPWPPKKQPAVAAAEAEGSRPRCLRTPSYVDSILSFFILKRRAEKVKQGGARTEERRGSSSHGMDAVVAD